MQFEKIDTIMVTKQPCPNCKPPVQSQQASKLGISATSPTNDHPPCNMMQIEYFLNLNQEVNL